ncbi:J domain-containing protein, partial [Candidatus Nomurabacteria bacterium]|nr:J domain-containing protein [Candidatus Nomurabacteria bacterium]
MEAPKQKSPDEIRAEELRRTIENAAKESREAREKLEAFMKAEKEGAAIKPASQEENLKPEVPSEKKKWGPLPQSPFMALGVLPGAPKEVVDEAYKKKAKEYFPDQPDLSPAEKKEAEERTKIINEARKLLTDPTFEPSYFKNFRIEDNLRRSEEGDTRIELWKEGRVVRRPDDRIVPVPKIPPIPQTPPTPPVTPNLVLPRRPRGPVPPPTPPAPIPQAPKRESWIKKSWKHVLLALG